MRKKTIGKCALCGRIGELSFEHIPPKAAFNSAPARPVSGEALFSEKGMAEDRMPWDTEGLRYVNQQQGMGRYSLCSECTNNTGSWYGDSYVELARATHFAMVNNDFQDSEGIGFKDIYPLRFIKQVLSMFCSINSNNSKLDSIRRFVLEREAMGLDRSKYKLCMYFTKSNLMKYSGPTAVIRGLGAEYEVMAMSEITAYPFGFILYFDPTETWKYHGTDIMACADCSYDEKADIILPWNILEMNDHIPESFRSKDEIRECILKNQRYRDELNI